MLHFDKRREVVALCLLVVLDKFISSLMWFSHATCHATCHVTVVGVGDSLYLAQLQLELCCEINPISDVPKPDVSFKQVAFATVYWGFFWLCCHAVTQ